MKKYLFGLGAMLVGAGLMFVLMHGEVSADSDPEKFVCSNVGRLSTQESYETFGGLVHCATESLACGYDYRKGTVSCVKKGMFK